MLKSKKVLTIILSLVFVLTISTSAFATYSDSPYSYATVYGYNYQYNSTVYCFNAGSAHAGTFYLANNNLPSGYAGALAMLFTSDGINVASSGWAWNPSGIAGSNVYTSDYSSLGYFYSCGKVQFYNGNGYNQYTSLRTTNLYSGTSSPMMETASISKLQVNQNNETYGSGLLAFTGGVEPDLIASYGVDGTFGYIRSSDLECHPKTPEEATNWQNKYGDKPRMIPLYDKDGQTVIGKFKLESTKDIQTNTSNTK